MAFNTIEELLEDYRQGKMVLLVDDEDRENEGDLLIAAERCDAQAINFMAREARGLICLTLTDDHCQRLGLEQMVPANGSVFSTAFTVSIEAATGVTTGISAADRARTVAAAMAPDARPEDLVQPGHIFPLRAREGGVLTRAGHTEAGCDLARLAGFTPASVIVEVLNDDGTMARRPDLEVFAERHGISLGTLAFAWVLRHPSRPRPITGSGRIEGLREAVAALDVSLDAEDWYAIWTASKAHPVP